MNLDRYAERIGWHGALAATEENLADIHFAHARSIPFENLDIHRGLGVRLDFDHVFDKIVGQKRGGYCYEQNGLLLGVLRVLGFTVRPLAARVLNGRADRPRTHMALLVRFGDREVLADVGFGTHNLLAPMPLEEDTPREIHGETFRFARPAHGTAREDARAYALDLEVKTADTWAPLYRLSFDTLRPADITMANWYSSTHPDSLFVQHRIVSRADVGRRWLLLDQELKIKDGSESESRHIPAAEYAAVLSELFGIEL